jgi:hypothetical protein
VVTASAASARRNAEPGVLSEELLGSDGIFSDGIFTRDDDISHEIPIDKIIAAMPTEDQCEGASPERTR